jgi:hypothetical protein
VATVRRRAGICRPCRPGPTPPRARGRTGEGEWRALGTGVVAGDELSFRLATLEGHLEAGQIEFRVLEEEPTVFEIESWARSADRLSDLLYHRVRMAKEVQLHMWISFLEGVVALADGRMTGGIGVDTRQVDRDSP